MTDWRGSIGRLAAAKYTPHCAVLAGLVVSLTYSLLLYPIIADHWHVVLDPDGYGRLGYGIWQYASFSYFPDHASTANRGPAYPLFVASLLMLSHGWYPYIVQIAQAMLFSLLCLMVYRMADTLGGRRRALLAGWICAVHPILIWYTTRIWVEILTTFLFTSLIASTLALRRTQTPARMLLVGAILGACVLSKETFLPFVIIVPLSLVALPDVRLGWRGALVIAATALALVAPWSARNWHLTGHLIPVHLLAGLNVQRGDSFLDNYARAPLSYRALVELSEGKTAAVLSRLPGSGGGAAAEVQTDSALLQDSLARYRRDPTFMAKKVLLNAWLFWTLGETPLKTAFISLLQLPLVIAFAAGAVTLVRRQRRWTIHLAHVTWIALYFGLHLPIFAFARLSVVLIPAMVVYGLEPLFPTVERSALGAPLGGAR
jgi:4-amino-4-deoxy-L-arabinose transferase-like glycosyltransferase